MDFELFQKIIFYVGKGSNNRKFTHFFDKKNLKKLQMIDSIFNKGHGVSVLQIPNETNDYVALSREYSIIKALRVASPNIINSINSVAFGDMKCLWTFKETINYGIMLIYNVLVLAVMNSPSIVCKVDLISKK